MSPKKSVSRVSPVQETIELTMKCQTVRQPRLRTH
jgi:hypothetical protein